jgi:hypothetical protein
MCDGHSRHATYDPATAGYEISLKTCHNTREAFLSGCCARAASGHAAAATPSSVMNSRRFMPDIGLPPAWRRQSVHRALNLPQGDRQVLGANLNCSE